MCTDVEVLWSGLSLGLTLAAGLFRLLVCQGLPGWLPRQEGRLFRVFRVLQSLL